MDKYKPIPRADSLPFNWINMAKDPLHYFSSKTIANNDIVDVGFFLTMPSYLLCNPDYIEHVLVKNNKNYIKSISYDTLKFMLGTGLLTSEGDFWKRQRRIAQPAFHKKVLAGFTDKIGAIVNEMMVRWENEIYKDTNVINIGNEMMKLTVQITTKLLFGTEIQSIEDRVLYLVGDLNERAIETLKSPIRFPMWVPTPYNLGFKKHLAEFHLIIDDIIAKRRSSEKQCEDLLQMLMDARDEETGEGMTDAQLRDEVMTLFIAGSETSSNTLSWTLYLFSINEDKELKARQEINDIVKRGLQHLDALRELRYLSLSMQESMRIFPPAWIISRQALEDDYIDGYKIPKDSQIYICVHGMQNHPKYWDEPEKFLPERFEQNTERSKYSYFPFGGGPRLCIGAELARMEIIITLFKLMQSYKFELAQKVVEKEPLITLRPKGGLLMKLTKIESPVFS